MLLIKSWSQYLFTSLHNMSCSWQTQVSLSTALDFYSLDSPFSFCSLHLKIFSFSMSLTFYKIKNLRPKPSRLPSEFGQYCIINSRDITSIEFSLVVVGRVIGGTRQTFEHLGVSSCVPSVDLYNFSYYLKFKNWANRTNFLH